MQQHCSDWEDELRPSFGGRRSSYHLVWSTVKVSKRCEACRLRPRRARPSSRCTYCSTVDILVPIFTQRHDVSGSAPSEFMHALLKGGKKTRLARALGTVQYIVQEWRLYSTWLLTSFFPDRGEKASIAALLRFETNYKKKSLLGSAKFLLVTTCFSRKSSLQCRVPGSSPKR